MSGIENTNEYPRFSVVMSVYKNDRAEWFDRSLESIAEQSVKPDEIVLVIDGYIPDEIQNVIDKYAEILLKKDIYFNIVRLEENQGLGIARNISIQNSRNDLIAVMDSDDISEKNRFKEQLEYIMTHNVDIAGGNIAEFIGEEKNIVSYRDVPVSDDKIKEYMKKRCPFNHMTVMFYKDKVESAGGYIDWYYNEDYYLWIRMALNGCKMGNTGTTLVNVRIGADMYNRRGGIKYFKSELGLQNYMLNKHIINFPRYIINITKRLIVQVLMPNRIRGWVFRNFARKKVS